MYQAATGAKVNIGKTKGLWIGKWKNRKDTPMNIKWTNKNVKTLGPCKTNILPRDTTKNQKISKLLETISTKYFR